MGNGEKCSPPRAGSVGDIAYRNGWRARILRLCVSWHMSVAYARGSVMAEPRRVSLFRNGRNQAVRIPVEFELPGNEAIMHRDGARLVIEPVRKRGLIALLQTMKPLDEEFPAIDDAPTTPEQVL